MAKNKISDLNNHLFAQIEKITDDDISPDELDREIRVSKSLTDISTQIIEAHRIVLDAARLISNGNIRASKIPDTFGLNEVKSLEEETK